MPNLKLKTEFNLAIKNKEITRPILIIILPLKCPHTHIIIIYSHFVPSD